MKKIAKVGLIAFAIFLFLFLNLNISVKADVAKVLQNEERNIVSQIEDGAVYFIKCKVNQNKVFDIPGSNYNEGTNVELYDSLGWGNQRFVLNLEFDNTYRIRPLDSREKVLAIKDSSPEDGKPLSIKNETNSDLEILSDKFVFEYNSSNNTFRIKTGASNFTKYLTLNEYNTNNKNLIVQKNYNSAYSQYFEWYLFKTDTLGVNTVTEKFFAPNESKWYLINVPYAVNYKLMIEHNNNINSSLSTYTDDTNQMISRVYSSSGVGGVAYASLNVSCQPYITIKVLVSNLSSNSGYISISFMPVKVMYMSGVYDYEQHKKDRALYLNQIKLNFVNMGYHPIVQTNLPANRITQVGVNGNMLINNTNYIFRGHGNAGGAFYYNGKSRNGGCIDIVNMPNLNNVNKIAWICCYSAKISQNHNGTGITSSLARESVVKGADYAVGWRDEIYTDSANTWTVQYGLALSQGNDMLNAVRIATEETARIEWWDYIFDKGKIYLPIVYARVRDEIVWYAAHNESPYANPDDVDTSKQANSEFILNDENYFQINTATKQQRYIKIEDYYTNISINDNQKQFKVEFLKNKINSEKKVSDSNTIKMFLEYNNVIKEYSVVYNKEELTCRYFNITDNIELQHDEFIEIAKLK